MNTQTAQAAVEHIYISPFTDIVEEENGFKLIADIPGAEKSKLSLSVENNSIEFSAETGSEFNEHNSGVSEGAVYTYRRSFRLGDEIDTSKIEAAYDRGTLTITLPKSEHAQAKKISIENH